MGSRSEQAAQLIGQHVWVQHAGIIDRISTTGSTRCETVPGFPASFVETVLPYRMTGTTIIAMRFELERQATTRTVRRSSSEACREFALRQVFA